MQKEIIKKISFYLYNYNNIDDLISERRTNIIDAIDVTNRAWLKSKTSKGNTLEDQIIEDQIIKLNNDSLILEYKRWQVFIKKVLAFLYKHSPITHKFLVLKYFKKFKDEDILKSLKIDSKALISIKSNLLALIYENAQKRDLI